MANLSNINGKFVVEQTTGYVGVGTTDPNYPIEVLNASAEIALNASGASIYRLRSDSTDSFRINKNGVGDRLVINGAGDATFSGKVNAGDRILTEATTSNALLQVKYNSSNYLEGYYDKLNVVGGDFLIQRSGDTKIQLTSVGTTFTNLSNTSAASSSADEVKIGTFGAGRPAIFLGTSNTTYTNSTWFIENIGASGKFRIGRNGLDVLEIENGGASTFKGSSVTVLNASDPSVAVSDTDTNYKGIMTWRNSGSENVLEFVTRYAGTYYTNNLVLDRGNVGIGTSSPSQKLEVTGNFKLNGTTVQEGTGNNLTFKYRTTHSSVYTGGNATCKFGRFYWTPAHWVNVAPVIKVTLNCKYYQGERREYIIKAGYQDTDPIINELQPSSTLQRITLVVGATTAAGYNYAGQPVYYVDLQWVQTSYIWGWAQIESQVPFLTSNPTSGWGGVVMDSGITQTNGSGLVTNNSSFFAGKLGIGTANPDKDLTVGGVNATHGINLRTKSGSNEWLLWQVEQYFSQEGYMRLFYDNVAKIQFRANGDSYFNGGKVLINKTSTGLASVGIEAAVDTLRATKTSSAPVEFNRLGSDGDIVLFYKDTANKGSISITSSAVSYNTSSDYRLKEDLQDFAGLNIVSKIPVYNFKWKTDESRSYGVMAHELQEVLPQAVTGDKDAEDMQSVDYSKIVPLLVKSIQELKAEIELLKNK